MIVTMTLGAGGGMRYLLYAPVAPPPFPPSRPCPVETFMCLGSSKAIHAW